MQRFEDEAWVLRCGDLGEADAIVTLFAAEHGRVRGVARSARKSRRRFAGLLEPFTRVRLTWTEKQGRDLHRIDAMESVRSYAPMQSDPALQAGCAVLAELTEQTTQEHHPDPAVFRLIGASLDALEAGVPCWPVVRYFQFWTLRLHGLQPDLDGCQTCQAPFDAGRGVRIGEHGDPLCGDCARGGEALALSPGERSFLTAATRLAPADLGGIDVGSGRALDRMLRGQLERFSERPLRTLRHLRAAAAPHA